MKKIIPSIIWLLGLLALYWTFVVVPNERVMGPVQRIFYFHVGAALACYAACAVMLVAALLSLGNKWMRADATLKASVEVAFLFCSIVMVTGMIWGKAAWNTAFRFEPRLVSFLVLWLMLLGSNLLRTFGDQAKVKQHVAVLAVISALTVPLVVVSIKFLPQAAQLHPQVVQQQGLRDERFSQAMLLGILTMLSLQAWLIWLRSRMAFMEEQGDGTSA